MRFRKIYTIGLCAVSLGIGLPHPVYAQVEAPAPVAASDAKKAGLMALARDFVQRVQTGYAEADTYYREYFEGDLRAQDSFVDIPDGEILLLQIELPKRLRLPDTVMAIKEGRDVLISLADFVGVARFRIDLDPEARLAEGWFIRENRPFRMDLNAGTVLAGDDTYNIREGDVLEQDGDFFIRGDALSEWMDFDMEVSLQRQKMEVASNERWPVQEAQDRRRKRLSERLRPPSLPRQESPYTLAEVPNADINIAHRYTRSGEGESNTRTTYNLTAAGDFASHTARGVLTGNDEDPVSSARLTFSRESDKPELLGPLGARFYEFGDVTTSRVPLAGGAKNGLGVHVTSKNPNITTESETQVIGEGTPGWDVEIYRGSQLLGFTTVEDDGRYVFDNIRLFPGDNDFRVVQYGPFGEIREERQRIFAGTDLFSGENGVYDVSVTAADTRFYSKNDQDTEDKYEPQISALYEMQVGEGTNVKTGTRLSTTNGDRKEYLYAGATTSIGANLINFDAAHDIDGPFQTGASIRRRFANGHAAALSASYTGDDYGAASGDTRPSTYSLSSDLTGALGTLKGRPINYNFDNDYDVVEGISKKLTSELGFSARYDKLNLNQNFRREWEEDEIGNDDADISGDSNIRGSLFGTRWRASAYYDIDPGFQMEGYVLDLTKVFKRGLRGNLNLEHEVADKKTEGQASLSFTGKYVTLSPTVTYDSEDNLGAFLNVRTGVTYDPYTKDVLFSGRAVSGYGGVSARVFLDMNGDLAYNEGEELLPEVTIEAIHSSKRANTNDEGVAFLYNLPAGRVTDLVMQEGSFQDAFWISAFEGVSVMPRAGHVIQVDFPVHIGGEIDGIVYKEEAGGGKIPLRSIRLSLHRVADGEVAATAVTVNDGFYLFDRVPPGHYMIILNAEDLKRYEVSPPPPQQIEIGYEGTTIYGNHFILRPGPQVAFTIPQDYSDFVKRHTDTDMTALQQYPFILNLGEYNSQVMMAVVWYKLKNSGYGLLKDSKLLVPPTRSVASKASGKHVLRVIPATNDLEEARRECMVMAYEAVPCTVEIISQSAIGKLAATQEVIN